MWYNSTPFILLLLSHSTLTRGTWLKLEDFAVKLLPTPAFKLTKEQSERVDQIFERSANSGWPNLLEQLRNDTEGRRLIDDLILEFVGIESPTERKRLVTVLRSGALAALEALLKTMVSAEAVDEDEID